MAKSRSASPKQAVTRTASYKRGQDRKAEARALHEANRKRNIVLRREGLPTPQEARREAHRAARSKLNLPAQPRNERGFIVEPDGKLRDPGNWNRRRKARYDAIANGQISAETPRNSRAH